MTFSNVAMKLITFPEAIRWKKQERKRKKKERESILTPADINRIVKEAEDAGYDDIQLSKVRADTVLQYNKNLKKKAEEKEKIYKKIIKNVLDTAEMKAGYSCNGNKIDSDLYKKINNLEALRDQYRYTKAAVHSQRLINYAIWRSTDPTAIALDSIVDGDKMFINGICKELHIDPIYKKVGALDLKLLDPWITGWNDQEYLINLSAVRELCSVNLQERINKAMNGTTTTSISNNGGYVPIHFTPMSGSGNILVDPSLVVDAYHTSLLEKAIEDYYEDEIPEHHFELDGNNYKVVIKNPSNLVNEEFRFNIGFFGKDVVSLIKDNNLGQIVYIHPNCKDIWEKVLKNCFYQLNEQDTNNTYKQVSQYFYLYNMVDFSTIPENDIINEKLDVILNTAVYWYGQMGINFSTYRFERYNGPKDFILNGADGSVIIYNGSECCYRLGSLYQAFQM